ncbi:MAG: hypothetical protein JWO82_3271 [Akkermansiaceae bacterium]|nr:hypothetical protein [Akkermansiaceae bacterium]
MFCISHAFEKEAEPYKYLFIGVSEAPFQRRIFLLTHGAPQPVARLLLHSRIAFIMRPVRRYDCVRLIVIFALFFPVALSTARGQTSTQLAEVRVRGDVRKIQPMPDGTFVLGGFTAYFNGARDPGLIRITATGTRVNFPVTVNGSVSAMALSGTWLYLGGDFQTVNNVSVPFAARVDATTGAVDPLWRPAPNGDLIDIVPVTNGVVLNGSFSRVSGLTRNRLAMVSATGAGQAVETWHCDANNQVDRLMLSGGWLYAAGRYTNIGGVPFSNLVRLNPDNGTVDTAWSPAPNGAVFDLATDGTNLYAAGDFTKIGGVSAAFLARLKPNQAVGDPAWIPGPDSLCARVCVSGDSVYASGNFTSISGVGQSYIARVAKVSGNADATWKPPFDGGVLALVSDGSNGCWAGGRFDSNGAGAGFAHFLSTQGSTAPVYPATIENLGGISVIKANPVNGGWLVGGTFDTVNGIKRHSLFKLTASRTVDTSWNAALGGYYTELNAMEITGGDIIIGGQFEKPGPGIQLLYNCLRLNITTGATVLSFAPQPSDTIYTLLPQTGTYLIGGAFNQIGNQSIQNLALLNQDGSISPNFPVLPDGPVHAMIRDGNDLYLAGEFTGFVTGSYTTPLPYLARFNGTSLDPAWQPQPNQAVFSIALNSSYLYAGGRFTSMGRQRRKYLAQIPLGGAGTPTAWNPAPDDEVRCVKVDGSTLYVGGAFFGIAGYQWPKLARFQLGGPSLDTTFKSTGENGEVLTVEPQGGGVVFAGGSFNSWDNDPNKRSLVSITGTSSLAQATPLPPADPTSELLADYFAPSYSGPLTALPDHRLRWTENQAIPPGMVSRVQWSTDMLTWHESGETAGEITASISIAAEGATRTAQLQSDSPLPTVFLRVAVTAADNTPSKTTR